MPTTHGPMNEERVNNYLAQVAQGEFCPGYTRWWMLKWTDWGLAQLAAKLEKQSLKPDTHNAARVALPILHEARRKSFAYINGDHIQSPVTPNFRDVVDCCLALPLEQTRTLMRHMRRFGQLLADHCDHHGIGARAWITDSDHARLSNPCFAMRLLVQGAVMHVRDGHGQSLLSDLECNRVDPLSLVKRALGPGRDTDRFLDAFATGTQGLFGDGKSIFAIESSKPRHRPKSGRRREVVAYA